MENVLWKLTSKQLWNMFYSISFMTRYDIRYRYNLMTSIHSYSENSEVLLLNLLKLQITFMCKNSKANTS